jgi:hypothetical protein
MKKGELLQVLLVAAAPVLFIAQHNADEIELAQIAPVMLAVLAAGAALFALTWVVARDGARSALLVSFAIALFFFYGRLFDLLTKGLSSGFGVKPGYALVHTALGSACVLALVSFGRWIWRTRRDVRTVNRGTSIAAVAMVAMSGISLVTRAATRDTPVALAKSRDLMRPEREAYPRVPAATTEDPARPDVYHIVLDGYARGDVLAQVYGFDNEPFLRALEQRGFCIARQSNANYPLTFLSLASMLNMRYLDDVLDAVERKGKARAPFHDLLRDPVAARLLQSRGYRYVHFATNYGGTEESDVADTVFSYRHPLLQREFVEVLVRSTALRIIEPSVAELHLYMFEKLVEVPSIEGPTFAFCHFLLPHNPYVFDREGNVRHDIALGLQFREKTGGWADRQAYIEQLEYTNRRVLESIDAILAKSSVRPVILLHSDHGSASTYPGDDAPREQWDAFALERLPILHACLVPEAARAQLYPSISPVNTYRVLFGAMFDLSFEPLPDESFVSWYFAPYKMRNVTAPLAARDATLTSSAGRTPAQALEAGAPKPAGQ